MAETDDGRERYERDPAFAARVRAAYRGRHEVRDAIAWLRHPLDPGPSGAPSPTAERDALARKAFSLGAGADDREALRSADDALLSDGEQLREAFGAARDRDEGDAADGPGRFRRIPALVVAVSVLAALVVGVLLGQRSQPEAVVTVTATPSPTATRAPALDIFDRPQTAADEPPASVSDYDPRYTRLLLDYGKTSDRSATQAKVFAAARNGTACLLVATTSHRLAEACVSEAEFPEHGLAIAWQQGRWLYRFTWESTGFFARGKYSVSSD